MSDRIAAFIVTLAENVSEAEAKRLRAALGCLTGVVDVQTIVSDLELHIAEARVRTELGEKIIQAIVAILYPKEKP